LIRSPRGSARTSDHLVNKLRIGGVPYGLGAPLMAGLADDPAVDLVRSPPTRLIQDLREGRLDTALASSVEGFRQPDYRAAAGLGIACLGPVLSVRGFRRRGTPVRTVAVDSSSASSVALLQVLLAQRLGTTDYALRSVAPTRQPDLLPDDLVLMIGDAGAHSDPGGREVFDLGGLWHEWTGLPFVFALWLLPPHADAQALVPRLDAAFRLGEEVGVDEVSEGAVHYRLGSEDYRGLERFRVEAANLGLIPADTRIEFIGA